MDGAQKLIDFDRSSQLRILERAIVPGPPSRKALLMAVDSFAGLKGVCFASINTLATRYGYSERTFQRALRWLAGDNPPAPLLVIETRKRGNGSQSTHDISLLWSRILDVCPREGDSVLLALSPHPEILSPGGCQNVTGGVTNCHPQKRHLKRKSKTHVMDDEVQKSAIASNYGWGVVIEREDLRSGIKVGELYDIAVSHDWIGQGDLDRLRFYALCRVCAIKGKTPGKYLTWCLKCKKWNLIRQEDEDAAKRIIAQLVHGEVQLRLANLNLEPDQDTG